MQSMPTKPSQNTEAREAEMSEEIAVNQKSVLEEINEVKIEKLSIEIAKAVNRLSLENHVNMPDFLIGDYLAQCFRNLSIQTKRNEDWHE